MDKKIFSTATTLVLTLVISVSAGARVGKKGSQAARGEKAAQSWTVEVTEQGFQPDSLKLKVNAPAKLIFIRRTDKTCVREVVIQGYDIKHELPLDKPVVVEFTPQKSGEFAFACGMGMLRGKLIVQ